MEDLCEVLRSDQTQVDDINDKAFPFKQAEEAVEFV